VGVLELTHTAGAPRRTLGGPVRAILGPPLYMYKNKGEEGEGIVERGSGGKHASR